jgi:hypothetical protein
MNKDEIKILAEKLELTVTQLESLSMPFLTQEVDGKLVDTEEDPSQPTMVKIREACIEKHGLDRNLSIGTALYAAGVITKEEGIYVDWARQKPGFPIP